MNHLFFHSPVKDLRDKTDPGDKTIKHTPVLLQEPMDYTSEGSEFLDDAIRMKDQPLMNTEESVTAGGPEDLL